MAASTATIAFGCLLKSDAGGGSFTTIAEVTGFNYSGMNTTLVDVSHMESPNRVREFKPALIDPGQMSFDMNYLPDSTKQTAIRTDIANGTKRDFELVFTDTTPATWSFSGYWQNFSINGEVEGVLKASSVIQLSGALPSQA